MDLVLIAKLNCQFAVFVLVLRFICHEQEGNFHLVMHPLIPYLSFGQKLII